MHTPKRNNIVYKFFCWFIGRIIRSDFDNVNYIGADIKTNQAVLLISNHFSWWDGFIIFNLNRRCFGKKFHVLVTEKNYNDVWFLKFLGAFSVRKKNRDMLETLKYAGILLSDPDNLVLIFPQGKLYSNHLDRVDFEKGLQHIINSTGQPFQYVLAATFIDYFDKRKPTANCFVKYWKPQAPVSLQLLNEAYNEHYQASLQRQCKISV